MMLLYTQAPISTSMFPNNMFSQPKPITSGQVSSGTPKTERLYVVALAALIRFIVNPVEVGF
jgi:hypothetical protein